MKFGLLFCFGEYTFGGGNNRPSLHSFPVIYLKGNIFLGEWPQSVRDADNTNECLQTRTGIFLVFLLLRPSLVAYSTDSIFFPRLRGRKRKTKKSIQFVQKLVCTFPYTPPPPSSQHKSSTKLFELSSQHNRPAFVFVCVNPHEMAS